VQAGLENILEDGLQLGEEIEVTVFLLVALVAVAMMATIVGLMGRAGACEGGGGFEGQDHRHYVRGFLKKVTSGFVC